MHRGEEAMWRPVLLGRGGGCSWHVRAILQGEPEATETTIVWAHFGGKCMQDSRPRFQKINGLHQEPDIHICVMYYFNQFADSHPPRPWE